MSTLLVLNGSSSSFVCSICSLCVTEGMLQANARDSLNCCRLLMVQTFFICCGVIYLVIHYSLPLPHAAGCLCSWLVYSDPGFGGFVGVLEVGEYPCPQNWGFPEPFIGSIRPLRLVHNTKYATYSAFALPSFCHLSRSDHRLSLHYRDQ